MKAFVKGLDKEFKQSNLSWGQITLEAKWERIKEKMIVNWETTWREQEWLVVVELGRKE